MDLTRMQAWTRQMLENEAAKVGIGHPELRTRAELIGLIMRHHYGTLGNVQDARKLVGSVVQSAVSALPDPFGTLSRWRTRLQLPGSGKPQRGQPSPRDAHGEHQPATAKRTFEKPKSAPDAPLSKAPPQPMAATPRTVVIDVTPPARLAAVPASAGVAPAAPKSAPSAGRAETRSFVEEPIRTRSMARLLGAQGHRERALAIYEELITKNSSDSTLVQEAEALRANTDALLPAQELPKPPEKLRKPVPESTDLLECLPAAGGGVHLRWRITQQGEARARTLLGSEGELAVRVVTIRPDAQRIVRSEITEHGPIALSGEWNAELAEGGARRFAAVGLRDDRHFVSIVHLPV